MPPSINRQKPPNPTTPTFPQGSILSSAVPVTSLPQRRVKLVLYGRNRSGKTTLAAQFKKPILFISCEPDTNGGADSISDIEGVMLIRVSRKNLNNEPMSGSAKVVAIARELSRGNNFATVVLDTATSLEDIIHAELLNLPEVPDGKGWGTVPDGFYQQRSEKLKATLRPLVDLDNCNLVILAQEKDHNRGDDRGGKKSLLGQSQHDSFFAASMGAKNVEWLQNACAYVIQILEQEVEEEIEIPSPTGGESMKQKIGTGRRQRHLRLLYHPNFAAGGRVPFSRNVPEFVTASTPEGLYKELARFIPQLK